MQLHHLPTNPIKLHTQTRLTASLVGLLLVSTVYSQKPAEMAFIANAGQYKDFTAGSEKEIYALFTLEHVDLWITSTGIDLFIPEDTSSLHYSEILQHLAITPQNASIVSGNILFTNAVNGICQYYTNGVEQPILAGNFTSIIVRNIYPGINWIIKATPQGLKYAFEVCPGADPGLIALDYVIPNNMQVNTNGDILIETAIGNFIEPAPYCFTNTSTQIASKYIISEIDQYHFTVTYDIAAYNHKDTLTIDPALWWCTYYGGSQNEEFTHITSDINGNLIAVGVAESTNFPTYDAGTFYQPTNHGNEDAVIVKFSATGERLWSTYYGGTDEDFAYGVTTDASGNIFVTGETVSPNFPVYNAGTYFQAALNGDEDVFILKFNSSGTRLWATFYGGDNKEGGYAIAADGSGNIFVTGYTKSTNFPKLNAGTYYQATMGGVQDAFLLKFNNTGTRIWASFYGGNAFDEGNALAIDSDDELFVTGTTKSTNFPVYDAGTFYQGTMSGDTDAYVIKFSNTGTRLWASYFGGTDADYGQSVICDQLDQVYFGGYTRSLGIYTYTPDLDRYWQAANAGGTDVYLFEVSNAGDCLWSTFYGGTGNEYMDTRDGLAVNGCNDLYVTQTSWSTDMPVYDAGCSSYYDATNDGEGDIFLTRFSDAQVITWATYYGYENEDILSCVEASAFEGNTLFLTGVYHEYDPGEAVPLMNPGGSTYYDGTHNGDDEPFIAKFNPVPLNLDLTYSNLCYCLDSATVTPSCGVAPYTYLWTDGQTDSIATGLCAGYWEVEVTDADCNSEIVSFVIDCILPMEIVSFTGYNAAGINTLNWEVPDIHQCSYYVLSRLESTGITPVYSTGETSETLFTITDAQYADSVMYYVLTGYDQSNGALFNQTISIVPSAEHKELTITYPEYEKAAVHYYARTSAEIQVCVMDMSGRKVMCLPWVLQPGENTLYFEHPYLPKGTYIVSVAGTILHASTLFYHQ